MDGQRFGGAVTGRRRFVGLAAGVVVSLAGCLGDETESDGAATTDSSAAESGGATHVSADGTTAETTSGGLDLREANVVGVTVEPMDGSYRFSVTLYHDDDGEDGYANWWQVETLDGKRLGRRELRHPHGTTRFTRSETVEIPSGTNRVVVRGHDRTHGYGGRAMVVTLESGATETVEQGSEPQSFGATASAVSTTTADG